MVLHLFRNHLELVLGISECKDVSTHWLSSFLILELKYVCPTSNPITAILYQVSGSSSQLTTYGSPPCPKADQPSSIAAPVPYALCDCFCVSCPVSASSFPQGKFHASLGWLFTVL